jgi:hypothetical protein
MPAPTPIPARPSTRRARVALARLGTLGTLALLLAGCAPYERDQQLIDLVRRGELGEARMQAVERSSPNTGDRDYLLDRYKIVALSLADGVPESSRTQRERLYDLLRTQGLNKDNTVGSFILGEGNARIWKGEPFEQAMAYCLIGAGDGIRGDWGNVRAAANNSLFLLRDFSGSLNGRSSSSDSLAGQEAVRRRVIDAASDDSGSTGGDAQPFAYTPIASDFELGYVLKALANRAMRDTGELDETLATLEKVAPRLGDFAQTIRTGDFNCALIVDAGFAPRKVRTGPGGAIAAWDAAFGSTPDDAPLIVQAFAGDWQDRWTFPVITDTVRLARDLRWNNLEDLRLAKNALGDVAIVGGAVMAGASDDRSVQLAGLGLVLAGLAMKSTSGADTRHCELLPQRTYVALLRLPASDEAIGGTASTPVRLRVQIANRPETALLLPAVPRPRSGNIDLHYIRLPETGQPWQTADTVRYANDAAATSAAATNPADDLTPWILGGRCVRTPTDASVARMHAAGILTSLSLRDLQDLYREEGIRIVGLDDAGEFGMHILEGGTWLFTPAPGSTGFVRLFSQDHGPYTPRSARVRAIAEDLARTKASSDRRD